MVGRGAVNEDMHRRGQGTKLPGGVCMLVDSPLPSDLHTAATARIGQGMRRAQEP